MYVVDSYLRVRFMGAALATIFALTTPTAIADPWTLQEAFGSTDRLTLSGSFRTRYESLHGQPRANLPAEDELISLRSTLFAQYAWTNVRLGLELYDSRAYLGEAGAAVSANEVNALELVQAYLVADLRQIFASDTDLSIQLGRFTLNLGSRRLVAADDYRNTTNGYTGLRWDAKSPHWGTATFIYTLPQRRRPSDQGAVLDSDIAFDAEGSDLVLWGGLYTTPLLGDLVTLDLSHFRMHERDSPATPTRNRRLGTTSVRVLRGPAAGRLDFEFEAGYQHGAVRASTAADATDLDVAAYFYHLELGYQWQRAWRPRLAIEYDVVSGDDTGARYERFDTLFGMRRADFAPSGIYAAVARANIRSPILRVEVTPTARVDAFLGYRALWLEAERDSFSTSGVRDVSGASGDFAGHQLDLRVRYWLIPQAVRFEFNGVWLDKGRFLRTAPNAPVAGDTRYLSFNLQANF